MSVQLIEENKTFNFFDKIKESTQNNQQNQKKKKKKNPKKIWRLEQIHTLHKTKLKISSVLVF